MCHVGKADSMERWRQEPDRDVGHSAKKKIPRRPRLGVVMGTGRMCLPVRHRLEKEKHCALQSVISSKELREDSSQLMGPRAGHSKICHFGILIDLN